MGDVGTSHSEKAVMALDIADFLGETLHGDDLRVVAPATLDSVCANRMVFAKGFQDSRVDLLNSTPGVLALVEPSYAGKLKCSHILVSNPRLAFARAVAKFFTTTPLPGIASTAVVSPTAKIGAGVRVGEYCVIEDNVTIGDNTEIRHHVVISRNVTIGRDCLIKSHAVIGEEGFGFDFDESKTPIRVPHVGSVRIGDRVEIGSGTRIARGTIDDTVVEDDVKTDDLVFIAHNVRVGRATILTANVEISGSVVVGHHVWMAPSATITNKVSIGNRAFIGIGAVVTKDVPDDTVVAGNPARRAGTVSS